MIERNLKSCLAVLCCWMIALGMAYGQRQITGSVTDSETGEPLIGATVAAVGAPVGAVTDLDGRYSVRLPEGVTQIRFSYSGYTDQIIDLGASNVLDVQLIPGLALQETVVIGYGTVKREDATGAINTVSSRDFNQGPLVAPQELIVGKVAGVQVTPNSDPGGGGTIRIRGGSSLSASNDPLIVIDGVPVDNGAVAGDRNPLNIVNPNDIETFTVLKDASATAIYGSRASNGVILITTKKGKSDRKIGVDLLANFSLSDRINQIDVLDADEYRNLINTRFADGHPARELMGNANTNWQDEIYQTGLGQEVNLGISGSVAELPYRVSLGFNNRDGILKTDEFQRYTGGLSLSPGFLNNTLQVNFNLKGMLTKNRFGNRGAIGAAAAFDPTQEVLDPNSPFAGYTTWTNANGDLIPIATANPVALLNLRDDQADVNRLITNLQLDYRFWFLKDLRANLNIGYDRSNSDGTVFEPANASFAFVDGGRNTVYTQEKKNELLEFYLNYTKDFGRTNLDLMGGYSWQHFYFYDESETANLDRTKILTPYNESPREYYLLSLFGRLNYTLFDRYLITATVRRDGTSRFSEDNRWGLFPSIALGWKIIDDRDGALNSLKLRLSYGETGQQDIGADLYPYLARYLGSFENAQYQFGNNYYPTLRPNGYDANIKWEQTATYNAGIDYQLFDGRVFGSLEYYYRQTTDLINFIPVPAGTNLTNFITTNVGDLENRGVEFSINTIPYRTANSSWELGANVTLNKNEITRLTATDDPNYLGVFTGGISGGVGNTIQIHSVGFPASSFFVYEQVYDASGTPIEGLYVDRNGDGQVTPEDRYRYENPAPDVLIGFYSSYRLDNFDIGFGARANLGNYVYNNLESEGAYYNRLYNSAGYISNVQSNASAIDFTVPQYFSDHFIQNASFLRFDHITAGYNFGNIGKLRKLRVSATVQNPFVITNYEGLDPEVFGGIDNNVYPRSRTYMFGVNASF
ncbi:MAG: SusC/RagA family TonB-linked outer membrane protein [Saprospiraceae bacterium]|nr:SusC/RagA family TonB-linked outer membrane protein [Saprospiraceae bacterium]